MDPLKPDPKAHEEARQNIGLLPFAHPIDPEVAKADKKSPRDWAVQKELLKLNRDRSVHYTTHTPWQYQCALVVHRWPDPEIDPTFVLTEEEFDEAIEAAVGGRTIEGHREHKKRCDEEEREREERRATEKRKEDEKLRALAAQIDANNVGLAAAVATNTPADAPAAASLDSGRTVSEPALVAEPAAAKADTTPEPTPAAKRARG